MCDSCRGSIVPSVGPDGVPGNVQDGVPFDGHDGAAPIRLPAGDGTQACDNRDRLDDYGVLAVSLVSASNAGKTALLEATIPALRDCRIGVIEVDLATGDDAARIRAHGVPAVQVTPRSACHLDGAMLHDALCGLDLSALDLLFIETVGTLACPVAVDLGQHRTVVLLSMTDGDDTPARYPVMFRAADLVLLTRADLAPVLSDFSVERATEALRRIGSRAPVLTVSARRGQGLERWFAWLRGERAARHAAAAAG